MSLLFMFILVLGFLLAFTARQHRQHIADTDRKSCRRCGGVFPAHAKFCARCGQSL